MLASVDVHSTDGREGFSSRRQAVVRLLDEGGDVEMTRCFNFCMRQLCWVIFVISVGFRDIHLKVISAITVIASQLVENTLCWVLSVLEVLLRGCSDLGICTDTIVLWL